MSLSMRMKLVIRKMPTPAENRDSEIFTVLGVFLALAAVALGLRFASKRTLRKPLRTDDYLYHLGVCKPLPATLSIHVSSNGRRYLL